MAITSRFHPDDNTHIEPCRYGEGSNFVSLMRDVLTDGDGDGDGPDPRWRTWLRELWSRRTHVRDLYDLRHWSERTVIALADAEPRQLDHDVHQADPGHPQALPDQQAGARSPNQTWIPAGNAPVRLVANVMGGTPGGSTGSRSTGP